VVAPVPWFPWTHPIFGEYATFARVPRHEVRGGIEVSHPRFPLVPRFGMATAPFLMAAAAAGTVQRLVTQECIDLIDAHYFYPDGVAAALLATRLGRPFVVTARGTDVSLIPRYRWPRRLIRWAAERAAAIITVCQALKDALVDLGVPADKITVLRNGVDLELFRPVERDRARSQLQFTRTTLLSVGHLIERKGHHIAIEAMVDLPDADLVIVGDGQMEGALRALAQARGVSARVRFVGPVPQDRLKEYYSAADALVLASSREGWANVLLESMACGTPVIATRIWGTPEVVQVAEAGVLMTDRTPQALTMAFRRLFAAYPDRGQTRRYAERFSWDETTEGQLSVFRSVVADKRRTRDEEGTGPTP
jgi:glycosyltransferase involved in cell wall biosynthesis